jgi:hypothetical protein
VHEIPRREMEAKRLSGRYTRAPAGRALAAGMVPRPGPLRTETGERGGAGGLGAAALAFQAPPETYAETARCETVKAKAPWKAHRIVHIPHTSFEHELAGKREGRKRVSLGTP